MGELWGFWTEHEAYTDSSNYLDRAPIGTEVQEVRVKLALIPCGVNPTAFVLRGLYPTKAAAILEQRAMDQSWKKWLAHWKEKHGVLEKGYK